MAAVGVGPQDDVSRLEIAMHDAGAVKLDQSAREAGAERNRRLQAQSLPPEYMREQLALDEFLDQDAARGLLAKIVQAGNVRAVDVSEKLGLAPEAQHDLCVGLRFGQKHLERDRALMCDVRPRPDFAHAALADPPLEPIASDLHARRQVECRVHAADRSTLGANPGSCQTTTRLRGLSLLEERKRRYAMELQRSCNKRTHGP